MDDGGDLRLLERGSQMNVLKLIAAVFSVSTFAILASAETIQLGAYSGQPGFFVRIGKGNQVVLNAIVMTPEAAQQIQKLMLKADLGQTKSCEVEGLQQTIGYTIFSIKSCK